MLISVSWCEILVDILFKAEGLQVARLGYILQALPEHVAEAQELQVIRQDYFLQVLVGPIEVLGLHVVVQGSLLQASFGVIPKVKELQLQAATQRAILQVLRMIQQGHVFSSTGRKHYRIK